MPYADINGNHLFSRIPDGGVGNLSTNTTYTCNCGCQSTNDQQTQTPGYWVPGYPPYPYPYDCSVNTGVNSTTAQIAKLSKKADIIRKMIENLTKNNKSFIVSLGAGCSYNFGSYLDAEGDVTDYGTAILGILEAELAAIKEKLVELTSEIDTIDTDTTGIESTVTL